MDTTSHDSAAAEDLSKLPDHPRGTLAILMIYAALFALGWAFLYLFVFLGRGAPSP